jgi:hypothetical protein
VGGQLVVNPPQARRRYDSHSKQAEQTPSLREGKIELASAVSHKSSVILNPNHTQNAHNIKHCQRIKVNTSYCWKVNQETAFLVKPCNRLFNKFHILFQWKKIAVLVFTLSSYEQKQRSYETDDTVGLVDTLLYVHFITCEMTGLEMLQ